MKIQFAVVKTKMQSQNSCEGQIYMRMCVLVARLQDHDCRPQSHTLARLLELPALKQLQQAKLFSESDGLPACWQVKNRCGAVVEMKVGL